MTHFIPPHQLANIVPPQGVLLALSGGADSCALLHLLADDAKNKGYALHLAHLHHGIRGTEADRDESFCRTLASHYGLPLHVDHVDVPSLAKESGESEEMAGRRARYAYFAQLMQQYHLPLLATAHHADDNLETVLVRLVSGSATAGLGGIAPVRPFEGGYLVRPLLQATRAEIEAYCEQNALSYVTDSTNADTAYLRNRLRAEIAPALQSIAPQLQSRLLNTCAALREDDDYLNTLAADLCDKAHTPDDALLLSVLQQAAPPLQKRVLLTALRRLSPDARIQHCHIEALCRLVSQGHGQTCLPSDIRASADGQTLRFLPHQAEPSPLPVSFCAPLQIGTQHLSALDICVTLCQNPTDGTDNAPTNQENAKNPQNVYNPFIYDTLTFDTISEDAYFRLRQQGDTLLLGGMHRKIRKLQNAAHIPPALRERLPILCDAQGVLWAPFVGARDGVRTLPGKYLLQLTVCSSCEAPQASTHSIS